MEIKIIKYGPSNCYLVKSKDGFILVDTGVPSERENIERELEIAGCKPGNLRLIIITQGDSDHAGNALYFRKKYETKTAVHRLEAGAVEKGDPFLSRKTGNIFAGLITGIILSFFHLDKENCFVPDIFVDEGFDLSEYGLDAKILHLPGHSNGSVGILTSGHELFCGDLLINIRKPAHGVGIFDWNEFWADMEKLKNSGVKTVYPGHGAPFSWDEYVSGFKGF